MACCSTNEKSLIVTTSNPIWHSCPVHPGTKQFTICSLKSKENIIFAHNFILKQNTNFTARRLENPEGKVSPKEHETYRSGVGELLYITKHSRADI